MATKSAKVTEIENGYVVSLRGEDGKDRFYTPHDLRDALDAIHEHLTGVTLAQLELLPGKEAK